MKTYFGKLKYKSYLIQKKWWSKIIFEDYPVLLAFSLIQLELMPKK